MVGRYYDGVVPAPAGTPAQDHRLQALAEGLAGRVAEAMDAFNPQAALAAIWEFVGAA